MIELDVFYYHPRHFVFSALGWRWRTIVSPLPCDIDEASRETHTLLAVTGGPHFGESWVAFPFRKTGVLTKDYVLKKLLTPYHDDGGPIDDALVGAVRFSLARVSDDDPEGIRYAVKLASV